MRNSQSNDKKYVDLHMHTNYSDGELSPYMVIKKAAQNNLETIAITDHDTTSGILESKLYAEMLGLEIIPGIEISTEIFHILGYGIDINDRALQMNLKEIQENQKNKTEERVKIIHEYGVPITMDKVLKTYPNSRLGKPNIIYTMLQDDECLEYVKNNFDEFDFKKVYIPFLGRGGIAEKISNNYEIPSKKAIQLIHDAGGIAIVAHPFKETKKLSDIDTLIYEGIDGIEIQPNFGSKNDMFYEKAKKENMIITYGSDYHTDILTERTMLGREEINHIYPFWRYMKQYHNI